jgi:hypothetical protein
MPVLCSVILGIALLFGACLNPVDFSEMELPTIKAEVSGKLNVSIDDVAVFWLINRTMDVKVTKLTIDRPRGTNETVEQYEYPMNYYDKPLAGNSLASYHAPSTLEYTITVAAVDQGSASQIYTIDPLVLQFPRPDDYKYYLYWAQNGDLVFVSEDRITQLPPDPTKNYEVPTTTPALDTTSWLAIYNLSDQDIDAVDLTKGSITYSIANQPRHNDGVQTRLTPDNYSTVISYTKGGVPKTVGPKNAIITGGSMAARTNFLYFYKTNSGGYGISQTWPPIPDDAHDGNYDPEDALNDNQGILEIYNDATSVIPNSIVTKIRINGVEYPDNTPTENSYFTPGMTKRYIVETGPVYVEFKSRDEADFGAPVEEKIKSKAVTRLNYTNSMSLPWIYPANSPYGAGVIQIINNSTNGTVYNVTVYNEGAPLKSITKGYGDFYPDKPVNPGYVGMVEVIGNADVNIKDNNPQIVLVTVKTASGVAVVQRAGALNGTILKVEIKNEDLLLAKLIGSTVEVINNTTTPTTIMGMYVYNKADPNLISSALYALDIPMGSSSVFYVLNSAGLPIVNGADYGAKLSVSGNGHIGVITKDFSPNNKLYSENPDTHVRTITLVQSDLPPDLVETFTPVTGITPVTTPLKVITIVETDLNGSNPAIKSGYAGAINLNHSVTVAPVNASKKSPIIWSESSSYVSIDSNSVLTVTGIAPEPNRIVAVSATIENAAGSVTNKSNFTTTVNVILEYQYVIRTQIVNTINLQPGSVQEGQSLDLRSLVVSLNPSGANINGVPITENDLNWSIVTTSGVSGSSMASPILTAGTGTGTITVLATLPQEKNGGTPRTQTINITVTSAPVAFIPVTEIKVRTGMALRLQFYTKTILGTRTLIASPYTMELDDYFEVVPSNATVQSITWSLQSTDPAGLSSVTLMNGDTLAVTSNGTPPSTGNMAYVRATVVGGGSGNTNVTANFSVLLAEHNTRPVQSGELTVSNAEITVGQTLDLASLVTLPPGAQVALPNSLPKSITADDLSWQIVSGSGYGSLPSNSSSLTGTAAGYITVQATLPLDKNGGAGIGTVVTATGTITVKALTPDNFTLRIIKLNASDYVSQIALVPVTSDPYSTAIHGTGHTNERWAFGTGSKKGVTKIDEFKTSPNGIAATYYTLAKKLDSENDWVDITLPWPTGNVTGYRLFFIEGDSRVRGYVNPGQLDPDQDENFLFFLRPDVLYNNYRLWMAKEKEVTEGSTDARKVIPIGYHSHDNTASIMKSQGVTKRPRHDLSDF